MIGYSSQGTEDDTFNNYNIDIVATSEDQAKDTYNVVYDTLDDNEKVFNKYLSSL